MWPMDQWPVFLQQLNLLEGYDLASLGHNSADYIHLLLEGSKLAFADREKYYGDPVMLKYLSMYCYLRSMLLSAES